MIVERPFAHEAHPLGHHAIDQQLRVVDGFVLNERATQILSQRLQQIRGQQVASTSESATLLATAPPGHKHILYPPKWLGWSLVSIGSVLVLYSLALKRPGG